MEVIELIRRGYRALGLGAEADVLAMFDQVGRDPARWVVRDLIASSHDYPTRDVVAMDLFGSVPPQFELIAVEPETWRMDEASSRLVVSGHFRVRPRGGWEAIALPFAHIWCLAGGRVERVISYLDGVELRRRR